jgi:uncharacterized membrane protein
MQRNEGTADRVVRAIAGVVALIIAGLVGIGSIGGVLLAVVGTVLVVTGAVGFCPLYRVLGVNTCPVDKQ